MEHPDEIHSDDFDLDAFGMGNLCSLDQRLANAATQVEPGDQAAGGDSLLQVVEGVEANLPGIAVRASERPLPVHSTIRHDCRPLQFIVAEEFHRGDRGGRAWGRAPPGVVETILSLCRENLPQGLSPLEFLNLVFALQVHRHLQPGSSGLVVQA